MKTFKVLSNYDKSFISAERISINRFGQVEFYDSVENLVGVAPPNSMVYEEKESNSTI